MTERGLVADAELVKVLRRTDEQVVIRPGGALAEIVEPEAMDEMLRPNDLPVETPSRIAFQLDGDKVESAKKMLASCREELRCSLWDLRSRTFEEKDMTEAIQRTLAPHAISADITVRFNVPRDRLSESTTHAILRYTAQGLPSKGIAREIGISANGINAHFHAIFEKLGASSRAEAVAIALRKHLLTL